MREREFSDFLRVWHPWLCWQARRIARRERGDFTWEDVLQGGLVRAWRALGTYTPGRATLSTWLTYNALAGMMDERRRLAHMPWDAARGRIGYQGSRASIGAVGGHDERHLERTLASLCVDRALAALTPRERFVVEARYLGDAKGRDVARALGVSPQRVSQLGTEAFAKMRSSP